MLGSRNLSKVDISTLHVCFDQLHPNPFANIQPFEALYDYISVGTGELGYCADLCDFNRTGDTFGEVLARRAEFTDPLPDSVRAYVDRCLVRTLSHSGVLERMGHAVRKKETSNRDVLPSSGILTIRGIKL